MSYIEIEGPNGVRQLVISFWFRIPQTSIEKARADYAPYLAPVGPWPPPPMTGIIPLMIFGGRGNVQRKATSVSSGDGQTLTATNHGWSCFLQDWVEGNTSSGPTDNQSYEMHDTSDLIDPSFIGIDCRTNRTLFNFRFQFDKGASGSDPTVAGMFQDTIHTVSPADTPLYGHIYHTWSCLDHLWGHTDDECWDNCPDAPATQCIEYPMGSGQIDCSYPADYYTITNATSVIQRTYAASYSEPEVFAGLPSWSDGTVNVGLNHGEVPGADPDDPYGGAGYEITPDRWHHVVLCIDMKSVETKGIIGNFGGGGAPWGEYPRGTISAASYLSLAIDDVNLLGPQASYFCPTGNKMLTSLGWGTMMSIVDTYVGPGATNGAGAFVTFAVTGQVQPSYKWKPPLFDMRTINIPGDAFSTRHCEMGELQIFTNVTIDNAIAANRRIFITDKGKPAAMSKAKEYFGKKPEVMLHRSGNWQKARNTGSLNDPPSDGVIVGDVLKYKPDPNLNGDQGK